MSRPGAGTNIEDRLREHTRVTRQHAAQRSAQAKEINDLFKSLEDQLSCTSKVAIHGSKLISAGICSLLMAIIEAAPETVGTKIPYAEPASDFVASFIGSNLPSKLHVKLCQAYSYCQSQPEKKAILDDYIKVLIDRNSNPERADAPHSEKRIKFQTAEFWARDETVDYIAGTLTSVLNSNITKTALLFAVETFYEPENIVHKGLLNITAIAAYFVIQKPAVKIIAPIVGTIVHAVGYVLCNGCSRRKSKTANTTRGLEMGLLCSTRPGTKTDETAHDEDKKYNTFEPGNSL
ncbi:MAG: hypothetical protein P1U63_06140 [Coxiellaceae bacterium]|nr:hypothetical protein [Coxiellaceae bacterium]